MATLTDQIDRFVRWFFNSSPDQTSIEPRPPRAAPKKQPSRARRAAPKRRPTPGRRSPKSATARVGA
jgi:hypothetical protein